MTVSDNGTVQVLGGELKELAIKNSLIVSLPIPTTDQSPDRFLGFAKAENGWSTSWRESGLLVAVGVNVVDEQVARTFVAEVIVARGADLSDFLVKFPVLREASASTRAR